MRPAITDAKANLAEPDLRPGDQSYRQLFQHAPVGLYRCQPDGRFVDANDALLALWGFSQRSAFLAADPKNLFVHPEKRRHWLETVSAPGLRECLLQIRRSDGRMAWVRDRAHPVRNEKGAVRYFEGVLEDIGDARTAGLQLRACRREKGLLLKEVHHRVKNNLQLVSTLLKLQASSVRDPEVLNLFNASQNRLRSMALIHENLYQAPDLAHIDFGVYAASLMHYLFHALGVAEERIKLELAVSHVRLNIDSAIPCGLILNELASNSLKHAFPRGRAGKISLAMTQTHGITRLDYGDDGIGIAGKLEPGKGAALGWQLVETLVDQLNGTCETKKGAGFAVSLRFQDGSGSGSLKES